MNAQHLKLFLLLALTFGFADLIAQTPTASMTSNVSAGCSPLNVSFNNLSTNAVSYHWDFGNGSTSVVTNPTVVYFNPGDYTVTLIATSASGISDTLVMTDYIDVVEDPQASFTTSQTGNCRYANQVTFTNSSTNASQYMWDFGDGHTSTAVSPVHTYSASGDFTVTLIASNYFGCSDVQQVNNAAHIDISPNVDFVVDATESCGANHVYSFTDQTLSAVSYLWEFGDGTQSTLAAPTHNYGTIGSFDVTLRVTNNLGCVDSTVKVSYISNLEAPDASGLIVDNRVCVGQQAVFLNKTTGTVSSTHWDFGNGHSSTIKNPGHTYTTSGVYDITLTTTNGNGCSADTTFVAGLTVDSLPVASFSIAQTSLCAGSPFSVSNQSTDALTYRWDFDNGSTSTAFEPHYTYPTSGSYNLFLKVTSAYGCRDTMTTQVTVDEHHSDFVANQHIGCAPMTVDFTDFTSGATTWEWHFGDGTTSSLPNPSHVYTGDSSYTVTLITSSASGCYDTLTIPELVHVQTDSFTVAMADTASGCLPYPVDFSNNIIGSNNWYWDFGDGNTSTDPDPIHVYTTPGIYTVSLVTENANGCHLFIENYATYEIEDFQAGFTADQVDCEGLAVSFADTSNSAVSWYWDFGDGNYSTNQNPLHVFSDTTSQNIQFMAISASGCMSNIVVNNFIDFSNCTMNSSAVPPEVVADPNSSMVDNTTSDSTVTFQTCAPIMAYFNNPFPDATSWHWDFGDGTTSNDPHAYHFYGSPGVYDVTLYVSTPSGPDTLILEDYIDIDGPTANFTTSIDYNCNSNSVMFTDSSTGADSWLWNFGDGTASNVSSPMHTYPSSDILIPVSLKVTDQYGCSSSYSTLISLMEYQPDFYYDDTLCLGTELNIFSMDTTSYDYFWNFGDGTTSTVQSPTHVYQNGGSYGVTVVATHALGCTKSIALDSIHVIDLDQDFIVTDSTNGCPGDIFTFIPTDTTANQYIWDIDGTIYDTVMAPQHQFNDPGLYSATLYTNKGGCADTTEKIDLIEIWLVNAALDLVQTDYCNPYQIQAVSNSFNAATYEWSYLGTSVMGGTSAVVNVPPGETFVTLSVEDIHGCTDYQTKSIIPEDMVADFTVSGTGGCAPDTIGFINKSINGTNWLWDFGDGFTSNLENPDHIYTTAGTYDVTLIAYSASGNCTDTITFTQLVHITAPSSDFSVNSTYSCTPMVSNFFDNSNGAISWDWDFGDGSGSSMADPIHVYTIPGYYDVTLTVTDVHGCADVHTIPNAVFVPGPIADFSVSQSELCDSGLVDFTDLSTGANNWSWTFGDGNSSQAQNPSHTYAGNGTYTVALIVEDTMGCISAVSMEDLIKVYETPTASFTVDDTLGCTPFQVALSDLSAGNDSVYWDMGDGSFFTNTPTSHIYNASGTYPITLIASVGNTCYDTTTLSINSLNNADATISSVPDVCQTSPLLTLSAAQAGGTWSGPGITDPITGEFDPAVAGAGIHTVAYQINGLCGDVDDVQINVLASPDATITPVSAICGISPAFNLSAATGGGVWSGTGITDTVNGTFDPVVAGFGSFNVTYATSNGVCSDQNTITIDVLPAQDASFSSVGPFCDNTSAITLSAVNGGGVWSGNGIVNSTTGEFDPQMAGVGLSEISYSFAGACGDTVKHNIQVNETPVADITSTNTIGCTSEEVSFQGLSTVGGNYEWDFGAAGVSTDQNPSVVFGPGSYDVSLIVTSLAGCADTLTIPNMVVVHDSIPSVSKLKRVSVVDNSSVVIEWEESSDPAFNSYTLYRYNLTSGTYDLIQTFGLAGMTSYLDQGLNTLDNSYCYKVVESDVCGNHVDIKNVDEHCTINISASIGGLHHTDVSWTPYQGCSISTYELYRCDNGDTALVHLASLDPGKVSFVDSTSYCKMAYSYKVMATDICGNPLTSWSDTASVFGNGIQDRQVSDVIRATVIDDESVWVEWTEPEVAGNYIDQYNILRSEDTSNFSVVATVPAGINGFSDETVDVMNERYFYKIQVINGCPASNEVGEIGSSILLQSEKISETKGQLIWTPYERWSKGVDAYEIQRLNEFNQWETVKVVSGSVLNAIVDF